MLPIALGFGAGAELRAPMAISIIGGLITSTLLSLIVVPVAYTLADDLSGRSKRATQPPPDRATRRTLPVARRPL